MTITDHAKGYVAGRKALGLSFKGQERILMRFAEFADARGDRFVRAGSVLDWAGTAPSVGEGQRRLQIVRAMAVFLHVGTTVTRCRTGTLSAGRDGTGRRRTSRRRRRSGRS